VNKNPQLDLVGWWTIGAASGPEQRHLSAQLQVQTEYNLESAPLLLFHPDMVDESSGAAGKLPLTIYETVWSNDSSSMEVDGGERNHSLKYREVRYTVETGEAEMISVDFVARGGGNATAVDTSFAKAHNAGESSKKAGKAKSKEGTQTNGVTGESSHLTPEEDELLTSLTAKANAIKMLQSRLTLLTAYLQSLPPSYLSDPSIPLNPDNASSLNQPILRSISALLARLPLLTPPDTAAFTRESEETASDVELITLLTSLTRTVQDAKELGRKWNLAEPRKGRGGISGGFSQGALGGLPDYMADEEGTGGGGGGGMGRLQELMSLGS
jgi:COP9 signalosome complex subunit 6